MSEHAKQKAKGDATPKAKRDSAELKEEELADVSGGAGPTGSGTHSVTGTASRTGIARTGSNKI